MEKIILIFGNTSSGKSFLGKNLEMKYGLHYLSFGDLKREEIDKKSNLGLKLKLDIENEMPINPRDGLSLINKNTFSKDVPAFLLSGYPVSEIEYKELLPLYNIILGIYLEISEETMRKRFFSRGVCPICHFPGSMGNFCPVHNLNMIRREDATKEEFNKRMNLFSKRIYPFIELIKIKKLFPLNVYNSESVDFVNIYSDIGKYLK